MIPAFIVFLFSIQTAAQGIMDRTFSFSEGETVVIEERFDEIGRWTLVSMAIADGELMGDAEKRWQQAQLRFEKPLNPKNGDIFYYIRFRTDKRVGPERAKLYLKMNLTDDPFLKEQAGIVLNFRPGRKFYLYLDPGWQQKHPVEKRFNAPKALFANPKAHESFRVRIRWESRGRLRIEPSFRNQETGHWSEFEGKEGSVHIAVNRASMKTPLVFRSIGLQMSFAVPVVDAVAVTQRR